MEDNMLRSIIDDTSALRQPEVGDRMVSFADTIEIIWVGDQGTFRGKTDRAVRFKVIEVHSPEDSSMGFDDQKILFGDLISDDGYVLVWSRPTSRVQSELDTCGLFG